MLALIVLCAAPAASTLLTFFHYVHDGQGDVSGLAGVRGASISSDGNHLFVAGAEANTLSVFSIHNGSLCFVESFQDGVGDVWGLQGANATAVSRDGKHVYLAATVDDALAIFSRDATADEVAFVEIKQDGYGGIFGLHGASAIVVSPDDQHLMIASADDAAVVVLGRDASSDELSMVDLDILPISLYGASSITVSPDGLYVYATAYLSNSLVVFSRDPATGSLDFMEEFVDGIAGVSNLVGPTSVAISPEGTHVFVAAQDSDALWVFERYAATGQLNPLVILQDDVGGAHGLGGISAVLVSPDGSRLFVASSVDNAVTVFRRTPESGELAILDIVDGLPGLAGASSLAVSPNGRFLYVTGSQENAIAAFEVAACIGNELLGDLDADAFCDDVDVCLGDDLLGDSDGDTFCDDWDLCSGFDDSVDGDGDGVPDGCDLCLGDDSSGDRDSDGVCNDRDRCPGYDDNADDDGDAIPDGCDLCFGTDSSSDTDGDGYCDDLDLCPGFDDGADQDLDGIPDGCDLCFGSDLSGDSDQDGVCDNEDLCQGFDDSLDQDSDGVPDGCDSCEGDDSSGDVDVDGVCGDLDCNDSDPNSQWLDGCGLCRGPSWCLFRDGFEAGDTGEWSGAIQ